MSTEFAPLAQTYSVVSTQAIVDPQPAALIQGTEPFATDVGQFTVTHFSGDPQASLTFVGGQGQLVSGATGFNSTLCIDSNAPLTIPQNFVSIDLTSLTASGFGYFTVVPCIAFDGSNSVGGEIGFSATGVLAFAQIQVIVGGTKTTLAGVATALTGVTSVGFGQVGNYCSVWAKTGGVWQYLSAAYVGSYIDFENPANLTGWHRGFWIWCNAPYTCTVDNLTWGNFGSVAMRDEEVVMNEDGTVYSPASNVIMFTASCNDPNGRQYLGLWTMNLSTFAVSQIGVIYVKRGGNYRNDINGSIVLMQDGTTRVVTATWGDYAPGGFTLALQVSTLPDQSILTNQETVLLNPTTLNVPGLLNGNYGAYDGFLIKNGSTWQLAYAITQLTSFAGSPFYPAFATSPDLVTWTLVGADSANLGYEGARQYRVNGAWYVLAGGPAGSANQARVYDATMTFLGTLNAVFNGSTLTQPHPMAFPLDNDFYLITFDATQWNGSGPFGNLILQTAPRYSVPPTVDFTYYAGFAGASAYAPVMIADAKGLKPRIWMPQENTTVKT